MSILSERRLDELPGERVEDAAPRIIAAEDEPEGVRQRRDRRHDAHEALLREIVLDQVLGQDRDARALERALRDDTGQPELVARAEDDLGRRRALFAARGAQAILGRVDARARVRNEREAALGEGDDARRALEERRTELLLELPNARAERRGR